MPVFAQTCRRGPSEVRVQDSVSESIRRSGSGPGYSEEPDTGYYDVSNLQNAVNSAIKLRELQTANIDKYLAATGQTEHKYRRTNRTIPVVGTTNGTKAGYITDKGLFKPWRTNKSMYDSSGKYGCPVIAQGATPQTLGPDYQFPGSDRGTYVGAAISQSPAATTAKPAIFVGSEMTRGISGELLPACGNEGLNVQVVYPGKATGVNYVGTYNIGSQSSIGYELQKDLEIEKKVTFENCMTRAEDKGASMFSYTGDKCYINTNSLSDAMSAGLGLELKPTVSLPDNYRGGQKLLHFGKDGTLNVLNTKDPTSGEVLYKFGLDAAIPQCNFKDGGVIMDIGGSWGLNCNAIEKPYVQEARLYDGYRSNDGGARSSLGSTIQTKNATNIRYEAIPEPRVPSGQNCNKVMGRGCGDYDGTFEEWERRGGSCPRGYSKWNKCTTGCSYYSWFAWRCS